MRHMTTEKAFSIIIDFIQLNKDNWLKNATTDMNQNTFQKTLQEIMTHFKNFNEPQTENHYYQKPKMVSINNS